MKPPARIVTSRAIDRRIKKNPEAAKKFIAAYAKGVALVRSQAAVLAVAKKLDGDEATGARLVAKAIEEPLRQIALNAGIEPGVATERVKSMEGSEGLNAATGNYEDLIKAGVADPTKVTRSALQNAASIAALFLTTEAVIADKPEDEPAMPGGGDMDF